VLFGGTYNVYLGRKPAGHTVDWRRGWLAGQIVQGTGFGLVGDIVIGIVGVFIASWLFSRLGLHLGAGIAAEIIAATVGAVLLLVIVRLVRRGGRW
jgi:uncharacterized membrane protein YeaQ/YmgE (transglycosylase-associated protein family)